MANDTSTTKARKPSQAELREALGYDDVPPQQQKIVKDKIDVKKGILRAIAQGVTFGTADEIEAFGTMLATGTPYNEAVKNIRSKVEQFREEEPLMAYGSEIGASAVLPLGLVGAGGRLAMQIPKVASGVGKATQAVQPATQAVSRVTPQALKTPTAKISGTGAGLGAAYGAGAAEEGERLSGALTGGAAGAVLSPLAPRVAESVKGLIPEGVKTTVGQTFEGGLGQAVRGVEDVLSRMPIFGVAPTASRQRALRSFNVAAVNQALEPVAELGIKPLKTTIEPRKAVSSAYNALSSKYDEILETVNIPSVKSLKKAVANTIKDKGRKLEKEKRDALLGEAEEIFDKYTVNNQISKQDFKSAQMDLRELSQDYLKSLSPADKNVGRVVSDISDTFFAELSKTNPSAAKNIKLIDSAYARFKPLQYLTAMTKESSGTFTPRQLLSELGQGGRRQAGLQKLVDVEKPLQKLAMDAQDVLPSRIVGSDTAMKEIGFGAAGLGVGQAGASPFPMLSELPMTLAKAVVAPAAVYNPPMQRVLGRGIEVDGRRLGGMTTAGALLRSPAMAGLLAEKIPSPISPAEAGTVPVQEVYTTPSGLRYAITEQGATLLGE